MGRRRKPRQRGWSHDAERRYVGLHGSRVAERRKLRAGRRCMELWSDDDRAFHLPVTTLKDAHDPDVAHIILPRPLERVPSTVVQVIKCCLREDTNRRPTFEKICKMLRLGTARSDNGGDSGIVITMLLGAQLALKRTDEDLLYSSGSVLYDSRGSQSDLII